jgi:hypothetical protein
MKAKIQFQLAFQTLATGATVFYLILLPADLATAASPTVTTLGTNAGISITTGTDDTALGNAALQLDTTGGFNTAVGSLALTKNVIGIYNTALGYGALQFNLANYNTALGGLTLNANTSGASNLAVGFGALYFNTQGSLNTALGFQALLVNTTGSSNVASGNQALRNNVVGSFNVAVGDGALLNSKGSGNIGLGEDGGYNLTTGSNNIYIGNPGGVPGGGTATESGIIRIGYTKNGAVGLHTDTYLAGVIHGNGSALTNVPTTALTGAIASAQIAAGAVGAGNLQTAALPATGQVLSFNGTGLSWTIPGGSVWALNGANSFYNGGNIGIGTNTPASKLVVLGGAQWTTNGWQSALELSSSASIGWEPDTSGVSFGFGHTNGGFYAFHTTSAPATFATAAVYDFAITDTGKVGIGTASPVSQLDIVGAQDALHITGYGPVLTMFDTGNSNARGAIQTVAGDVDIFTESYLSGANTSALLKLANNGNVGIGTPTPGGKLEIAGAQDALRVTGYQPCLTIYDTSNGYARGRIQSVNGGVSLQTEAVVNGSSTNAYALLGNDGSFSVKSLTIRGGADLAEPFNMKEEKLEKGSVVVIDEEHPGRLRRSSSAYDTRVAGIVSGANGVNPGISLHQEGVMDGEQNVALSGRVYVEADTSGGPIRPGDLLTTSDLPGHAMRATDHARAQGAIIGKAMSALDEGTGMVLVLVTLQ